MTLESMLHSHPKAPATGTSSAAVGRVSVDNLDTGRTSLVLNEALQLPECPAMESCARAPTRADVAPDVREVFQHNSGSSTFHGRGDNCLARLMVDVPDTAPLSTGDLPKLLFRASAAVGLKAATQGKVSVAPMAQALTTKDLARANGGECIFSNVHTYSRTGRHRRWAFRFYDQVEEPPSVAKNQLGFLRRAGREDPSLVRPEPHSDDNATFERVERDLVVNDSVGPLVKMDTTLIESNLPHRLSSADPSQSTLSLICLTDRIDGVASHLAAQIRFDTHARVAEPVQVHAVPTSMLDYKRHQPIAGIGINHSQGAQSAVLFRRDIQSNRSCTKHVSMPITDQFFGGTKAQRRSHALSTLLAPEALEPNPRILYMHTAKMQAHLISPIAAEAPRMTEIAGFIAEVL